MSEEDKDKQIEDWIIKAWFVLMEHYEQKPAFDLEEVKKAGAQFNADV